jgi:hypothetical protein
MMHQLSIVYSELTKLGESLEVVSAKKITRNDGLIDCVRWCRRWQHSWTMARKHGG